MPAPAEKGGASRGGRPSREESAQLRERILDCATELMLTQGYGATSIEAVAAQAGVSKRTFYHRFADKAALVAAVVARLIDASRPPAHVSLFSGDDLEAMLGHLARLMLQAALAPRIVALFRLIVAESHRFPELLEAVLSSGGRKQGVDLVAALLRRHLEALDEEAAAFAAEQFLQMVVSLPQMRALGFGTPMQPGEIELWVGRTVALFLRGVAGTANKP